MKHILKGDISNVSYTIYVWIENFKCVKNENEVFDALHFQKRKNTVQTAKKTCAIYGYGVITKIIVLKWFTRMMVDKWKFLSGTLLSVFNHDDQIKELIVNNLSHLK